MDTMYKVSSNPHVREKVSTRQIMLYVIIALLPATCFGVWNFGLRALLLVALSVGSCVASEWIYEKIVHKKSTIPSVIDGIVPLYAGKTVSWSLKA